MFLFINVNFMHNCTKLQQEKQNGTIHSALMYSVLDIS